MQHLAIWSLFSHLWSFLLRGDLNSRYGFKCFLFWYVWKSVSRHVVSGWCMLILFVLLENTTYTSHVSNHTIYVHVGWLVHALNYSNLLATRIWTWEEIPELCNFWVCTNIISSFLKCLQLSCKQTINWTQQLVHCKQTQVIETIMTVLVTQNR